MAKDRTGFTAIFDLDGTLVDTAADLAASMNTALGAAGLPAVDPAEVRGLVGRGARAMLARGYELAAGRAAGAGELDDGLAAFLDHYADNIATHSRPFDGVLDLIADWRGRGGAAAVCTNKREHYSVKLLEALEITHLFDAVVGADTASAPKPDAAPVRLCLERTGAARAVFFGDSDTDIKAARAAGVPCLIARFGYGPVTLGDEAEALFDDYEAAGALLEARF